jgi:Gpi16 subunit, GPI transamidase component
LKNFYAIPLPAAQQQPDLSFNRHLLGFALDKGQIRVEIRNMSAKSRHCRIIEIYPWQMRLYVSSIRLNWFSTETGLEYTDSSNLDGTFSYSPCLDREHPSLLERDFILLPYQSIIWTVNFDKKHTHYSEYPMDPNRGIDIP